MRVKLLTAASLVLVLAMVLTVAGLVPAASQPAPRTLHLNFPNSSPRNAVDVAPKGEGIGDRILFAGRLTDEAGDRVGSIMAEATVFDAGATKSIVYAVLSLPGQGTLTAMGRNNFTTRRQGTFAITGGTHDFAGESGQGVVTFDEETGNINLDITLSP